MKVFITKKEARIFLSALIIYLYFTHWSGWNETTRIDLTQAIIDEGKITIDSYFINSGDRAYYYGHYYTDKPPGTSIVAILPYALSKAFLFLPLPINLLPRFQGDVVTLSNDSGVPIVLEPILLSQTLELAMIFVTLFVSALPAALNVVLLYHLLKDFNKNEHIRLIITITYGLGTLAFPYALVFLPYSIGISLTLLAFYIIQHAKSNKNRYLLAGALTSLAITFDSVFCLTLASFFVYIIHKNKYPSFFFLIGVLLGIIPLVSYNLNAFGSFFMGNNILDKNVWDEQFRVYETIKQDSFNHFILQILPSDYDVKFNPQIILQILLYPYRGLFFYYPLLLFSLVGLYSMWRNLRSEFYLIFVMSVLFVLLHSLLFFNWHGGKFFGPRFFTPLIPFLMLPIATVLNKKNIKIFLFLAIFSMGVNFLGLQAFESHISDKGLMISTKYLFSLQNYTYNPLLEHYLPLTLENGPRSRLFESLFDLGSGVDIRDIPYSKGVLSSPYLRKEYLYLATLPGLGFLVLNVPFFCLIPLSLILMVIWSEELFLFLRKWNTLVLAAASIILICLLITCFLSVRDSILTEGWYPKEKDSTGFFQYFGENASMLVFNKMDTPQKINLQFSMWGFQRDRLVEVDLNGESIGTYNVSTGGTVLSTTLVQLMPGPNRLLFKSLDGCDNPPEIMAENKTVICYGAGVREINVIPQNLSYFDSNWYAFEEDRYGSFIFMSQNATLKPTFPNKKPVTVNLSFTVFPFYRQRSIETYYNGELVSNVSIGSGAVEDIVVPLQIKSEDNQVIFHSSNGCEIPSEVGEWNRDVRCLSFGFRSINFSTSY